MAESGVCSPSCGDWSSMKLLAGLKGSRGLLAGVEAVAGTATLERSGKLSTGVWIGASCAIGMRDPQPGSGSKVEIKVPMTGGDARVKVSGVSARHQIIPL